MSPEEAAFRARHGLPADATGLLIYDSAAHLDYDWQTSFSGYYHLGNGGGSAVENIYPAALTQLQSDPKYPYSLCEMDFFRLYLERNPEQVDAFRQLSRQVALSGGGITSPDNLLTHGEAFFRNYLCGRVWLGQVLPELLPIRHAFLPDDFGHDPELPAALRALGMRMTAFWRVPGNEPGQTDDTLLNAQYAQGIDFVWQASDGSTVLAHWLQSSYTDGTGSGGVTSPSVIESAINAYYSYTGSNGRPVPVNGARSRFYYIPAANDFSMPNTNLIETIQTYNQNPLVVTFNGTQIPVQAAAGTFAEFTGLMLGVHHEPDSPLTTTAWDGRPYWTGHYMSRPELKILHYETARRLLAAEALGVMAAPGGELPTAFTSQVLGAWTNFSPSSHHDFVNGTSPDQVYEGEQLTLLRECARDAQALVESAISALAATVSPPVPFPLPSNQTPVVVANPLGIPLTNALVELVGPPPSALPFAGVTFGNTATPVQSTANGLLFLANVPSAGYVTGMLTTQTGSGGPTVSVTRQNQTITLTNGFLSATIDVTSTGGISVLLDANGNPVLSGVGNAVSVFQDDGDLYEFGYEYGASQFTELTPNSTTVGVPELVEEGPLRAILRVPLTMTFSGFTFACTLEYTLIASEPFLRMTITGAAPAFTSIVVTFPLTQTVDTMVNGTPNHWTSAQQKTVAGWGSPVFVPTHRFVLPQADGGSLIAAYQADVPAWTFDANQLRACVLRNTDGTRRGAHGTDTGTHTLRYALRPPNGLSGPQTAAPLMESLAYACAPVAAYLSTAYVNGVNLWSSQPSELSLAAITGGVGVIMAVKAGDLVPSATILRLYQPTNAPRTLTVTLANPPSRVIAVSALEEPLDEQPQITLTGNTFTIEMAYAIATVEITW